jgi:hypothetical protein
MNDRKTLQKGKNQYPPDLTHTTLEHDSCYRGRVEIYRDQVTGEVVYMRIVR